MAAPIPVPPPVTMAILFASCINVSSSGARAHGWVSSLDSCRLMERQACRDRLMDRPPETVLPASPNDGAAQRGHLDTAAIVQVAPQRCSPSRRQRGRLLDAGTG